MTTHIKACKTVIINTFNKSSELYSFSESTLSNLRKFRFSSARAGTVQGEIYQIDKTSYEIQLDGEVIQSLEELVEELPENTPRFVILSYPKEINGIKKCPLVMIYWLPRTSVQNIKMLYAGCVELMRNKAGVSQVIEINEEEDLEADELESKIFK